MPRCKATRQRSRCHRFGALLRWGNRFLSGIRVRSFGYSRVTRVRVLLTFLTTSLRYLRILASLGVTWCDTPYFLAYPHVFLTCGPFIGFLGFFGVGQNYSCVGVDRHDDYSADSSASLAQCGFVGGFIPNFSIFALVSDHLTNFCFYSWDSLLVLPSLLRLPILLSLSLLWWLALGVTAAAHLLWWPLLCCLRGISFCSSSAVSSSSYSCSGCCQLLLSLLGVSVQLVLVHLRFFHSVSCGWLPFWGSPAGCSFTRGRPYGRRSSSSSRSGGRRRFRGVRGGGGSFFRPFGFPEVGTISFPAPFRRLSVPPLAGLEG